MTIAVDLGRKATKQTNKQTNIALFHNYITYTCTNYWCLALVRNR